MSAKTCEIGNDVRKTPHQIRVEKMMIRIREMAEFDPLPDKPTIPVKRFILNRAHLILEEVFELIEAMGVKLTPTTQYIGQINSALMDNRGNFDNLTKKDLILHIDEMPVAEDLPHIAKELADLSVVNVGTFSEFGLSDDAILKAVDQNNLEKFSDGAYVDENRKLRKPPDFVNVDLSPILKKQGWENA